MSCVMALSLFVESKAALNGKRGAMWVALVALAVVLTVPAQAAPPAAPPPVMCDPHSSPAEYCPGGGEKCPDCGHPVCACPGGQPSGTHGVSLAQWNSSAGVLRSDLPPAVNA